jgi:hypothetical protein
VWALGCYFSENSETKIRKIPIKIGNRRKRSVEGNADFDTGSGVKFQKSIPILKNIVTATFLKNRKIPKPFLSLRETPWIENRF